MHNVSLEQFYRRINKKVAVLGGYLDDKSFPILIKSCRLKPSSVFSATFDWKTLFEPLWVDEYGKAIEIRKKKAKIKELNLKIPNISTDLFKYQNIKFLVQHSKFACVGLDPDSTNFYLLLMGTDNYFRCYICQNDSIQPCSALSVGLKILRYCINPKPIKYFKKLSVKSELKQLDSIAWTLVPLPASKMFLPNIVAYSKLRSILYNE